MEAARRRPDRQGVSEVRKGHSPWVDWSEDHTTSATAFAEVLGDDIDRVVAERSETLLRRARRVLECSGPAPWTAKESMYRTALRLPTLHSAAMDSDVRSGRWTRLGPRRPRPGTALPR